MPARIKAVVLDAVDHQALADWWCAALGYQRRQPPAGYDQRPAEWPVPLYDPAARGPMIWVNPVRELPEDRSRVRLDVYGHTDELLSLGAVLLQRHAKPVDWDVLADPEGNEFSVFPFPPRRPPSH
ncbi:VOC family protein [Streptomyces oceani]|uniref:Bleomycin resistance protein n=1 Tax=Streptomyces oceani TaxID=1075402 RepID=A0A1E7JY51_9ACTN|nr:VOC family protein [Streptomyces oceani]OEU96579.1 bleomycin resistance protein [Streptomyces oceani]